jgi:hypothetical protein
VFWQWQKSHSIQDHYNKTEAHKFIITLMTLASIVDVVLQAMASNKDLCSLADTFEDNIFTLSGAQMDPHCSTFVPLTIQNG